MVQRVSAIIPGMKVRIRFFAIARERADRSEVLLDVPANASVGQALDVVGLQFPKLPAILRRSMIAVNREYVERDHRLQDNDEIAIIPPVSGGAP
ncbi:MAG: MoaD/ThiS family protein [Dehalococcoidia bacterium]|nr:MoaD/ThiS family protein [Dehalococcoidia bacterium]